MNRPAVLLTAGDPAGVGPEVALKAAIDPAVLAVCRPILVGDRDDLIRQARALGLAAAAEAIEPGRLPVVNSGGVSAGGLPWGKVDARAGAAAVAAVRAAVQAWRDGVGEAICTAPLNKEAMHLAGCYAPGHTELLGELTGAQAVAMVLVARTTDGRPMRAIHVTTHVGLAEVPKKITTDRVLTVIWLADQFLRDAGLSTRRIAVAGLNPHAGEGGAFGREEIERIVPAIAAARQQGVDASGPHPGDAVFWRMREGHFDIVVAMYHDQGHIPIKLSGFDTGVNVTAGLPLVRTSPDHGTAFDIAGRGVARPESMVAAVLLAAELARARRPD